jgi:Cu+-exporting ATPase
MAIENIELDIDGMTCASCSGRVERKLQSLEGTGQVSVNLASEQASFSYDTDRISLDEIINGVESLGYTPMVSEIDIGVSGMTCAACSGRVERMLNKQPGVLSAEVNLATEQAHVRYLPATIGPDAMMSIITGLGYEPRPLEDWKEQEDKQRQGRFDLMRRDVVFSFALTLPVVFLAMGVKWLPGFSAQLDDIAPFAHFWEWVQFLFTTIVIVVPGRRFFRTGLLAYRHLSPDMNSLVMTGTGAAWLYSSAVLVFPALFPEAARHVFFESAAVVISVVLLGKYLEERAKGNASQAIRQLVGLQPRTATVIRDDKEIELDVSRIVRGDKVLCKPGSNIPVDGLVLDGESYVDESMISGEPVPVLKQLKDEVVGGTLNQDGMLLIEATRVGRETVLAQIINMVEQAQAGKLPLQTLADRVILVFTPTVLLVALITFLIWFFVGPEPAITHALIVSVAVLVVACPCAMGLATPAAIMVGTGRGAELGVLFRKGEALERMSRVDHLVFDKTGTLTVGRPSLVSIAGNQPEELLMLAASVEKGSEHPLGRAIIEAALKKGVTSEPIEQFRAWPGMGVSALVSGVEVKVGTHEFVDECCERNDGLEEKASEFSAQGETPIFVSRGGELIGVLGVSDPVRPESLSVIREIRNQGLAVSLLTGDHSGPAKILGDHLGIEHVEAGLLPAQKAEIVRGLRAQGAQVAFVGDGINDAPALVEADVGIAMGSGTDIAIESADVILMGANLGHVLSTLRISKSTVRTIKGNLFWAFIYNILLIPVAAGLLYPAFHILLNPMLAGAAMGFSSIFVVLNSLRLRHLKPWTFSDN